MDYFARKKENKLQRNCFTKPHTNFFSLKIVSSILTTFEADGHHSK